MTQRHDDALFAQGGACNGLAVSKALAAAYTEAREELRDTYKVNRDPAIRLILHQLCHLAGLPTMDSEIPSGFRWLQDEEACRRLASDNTLTGLRLERPPAAAPTDAPATHETG